MITISDTQAAHAGTEPITARFLWALAKVESGCDPCAIGDDGASVGILQISVPYLQDCNRIVQLCKIEKLVEKHMGRSHFLLSDRHQVVASMLMARIYLTYWGEYASRRFDCRLNHDDLCTMHRWGGPGWRPSFNDSRTDQERIEKLHRYMTTEI